jgi:hypothetical protein
MAFVSYCAAGKSDTYSTKQSSGFRTCGPVGVCVCMCHESIEGWLILQECIVSIAVDDGSWVDGKFELGRCLPEVKTVVPRTVEELQSMFKTIVVQFVRTGI